MINIYKNNNSIAQFGSNSSQFSLQSLTAGSIITIQNGFTVNLNINIISDCQFGNQSFTLSPNQSATYTQAAMLPNCTYSISWSASPTTTTTAPAATISINMKVADIYVPEDGCGPYALSICGGVDAAYFKVIGKELYFDENKFNDKPVVTTTTTTQTTTIDPNLIQILLSGPYNDVKWCVGITDSNFYVEVAAIINFKYISKPQVSYQWQENINGNWVDLSGKTSNILINYPKINNVRVKVTCQGKTVISQAARGYCVMA